MSSLGPINSRERLPWGYHFAPTEEELIVNLKAKVQRRVPNSESLREIDLSKVEPWDIKDVPETCPIRGAHPDPRNQYFYAQLEQKYRHGSRANRATGKGFWKATGRDKQINGKNKIPIGWRKALVFYEGRAPHGNKTSWILHEFRLTQDRPSSAREEAWVACHMFVKDPQHPPTPPTTPQTLETYSPLWLPHQQLDWATDVHHAQPTTVSRSDPRGYSQAGPSNHISLSALTQQSMMPGPSQILSMADVDCQYLLPPLEDELAPHAEQVSRGMTQESAWLLNHSFPSFNERNTDIFMGLQSIDDNLWSGPQDQKPS